MSKEFRHYRGVQNDFGSSCWLLSDFVDALYGLRVTRFEEIEYTFERGGRLKLYIPVALDLNANIPFVVRYFSPTSSGWCVEDIAIDRLAADVAYIAIAEDEDFVVVKNYEVVKRLPAVKPAK